MRPAKFEYFAPATLAEAATLLAESDGAGRIIAGGQSIMAAMNLRLARPSCLIDLRKAPGLDGIAVDGDNVRIGAMTTHAVLIRSPILRDAIPLIAMAGRHIAHSTIREHGTMGGSLALADPASEWPTVLTLLGGRLHAVSVRGERWIAVRDFFLSFYTTDLAPDEILVEIEIPRPRERKRFAFAEFARQTGAFAIAMAAVSLSRSPGSDDLMMEAVLGGCSARPMALQFDKMSRIGPLTAHIADAMGRAALTPTSDIHASSEDRLAIASSLLKTCISELLHSPDNGEI
jgi:carbon-monoxide dehydrogenase medium subunit